ncbi:unnamed protein product [Owenia fusiformis]|uniref:Uncharacterized protein n=1 Tax=Owenia fusiformis TaxID=6347 RepID=A0A8J1YBJ9_OWEFU|nr:unnamed protein product [Owenia fusiformis]
MQEVKDSLPSDYPITGLCIVSNQSNCPPGYQTISKSYDRGEDADLWKDSIFKSKVTRYLCTTRHFPLDYGRLNNVLADILIQNEKDIIPTGFTDLGVTLDTKEKSIKKKMICVKMLPREATTHAICELLILSGSRRPPTGYTLAGELNNLMLCFKMGEVPRDTKTTPTPGEHGVPPAYMPNKINQSSPGPPSALPYALNPASRPQPGSNQSPQGAIHNGDIPTRPVPVSERCFSGTLVRQASILTTPLSGVPFSLNPRYTDLQSLTNVHIAELGYRSLVDIENEYQYNFRLERTITTRSPDDLE